MRGLLVALVVIASFIIVVALGRQKPAEQQPQTIAVITSEAPVIPAPPQANVPNERPPATTPMPEPMVITSWKDVNKISDPNLRLFVRRKANFGHDTVLYFEWRGAADDKMTGDLVSKDKKYTITLHQSPATVGQEVIHRQVFVIPGTYSYVCEIAK